MKISNKVIILLTLTLLTTYILAGCKSSANTDVNTTVSNTTSTTQNNIVKTDNLAIAGAWQYESTNKKTSTIVIFRGNGTTSSLSTTEDENGNINKSKSDCYYEITENGKDSFKLTCSNMYIDISGEKAKLVSSPEKITMLVGLKDKDTIQITYEGSSSLREYKKMNSDLAESMIGGTIFGEKGTKALDILKNYLDNQEDKDRQSNYRFYSYDYVGTDIYFVFEVLFQDSSTAFFYVDEKDSRLFTQEEFNLINKN